MTTWHSVDLYYEDIDGESCGNISVPVFIKSEIGVRWSYLGGRLIQCNFLSGEKKHFFRGTRFCVFWILPLGFSF